MLLFQITESAKTICLSVPAVCCHHYLNIKGKKNKTLRYFRVPQAHSSFLKWEVDFKSDMGIYGRGAVAMI